MSPTPVTDGDVAGILLLVAILVIGGIIYLGAMIYRD